MNISLEQAETVVKAAKEKARQLNTQMNIAIVDAGVNLVAFARMDDAWIGSIDIALRKARTARYFNMESGRLVNYRSRVARPGKSSTLMVDWSLSRVEYLLKIAKVRLSGR